MRASARAIAFLVAALLAAGGANGANGALAKKHPPPKRDRPADQVQSRDPNALASMLRQFGAARDPDALAVILSFVDADRLPVREAARAALAGYGDDALPKLRDAYAAYTGNRPPKDWTAAEISSALFMAFDRARRRDLDALIDGALAQDAAGDSVAAAHALDEALARSADVDRKAQFVPVYVHYARTLAPVDPVAARFALERARTLDPTGPHAAEIAGALARLDADDLARRGLADPAAYRRALALDPGNVAAQAALIELESAAEARDAKLRRLYAIAAGLLTILLASILFLGRTKRNERRAEARRSRH